MPRRNSCFWTRKLEFRLVEFVRKKECIWRPVGNTNHHIQQKYKAYAEFAASLGQGFTARSVRDRWVNIRCTFNHNLRKVEKSKETAKTSSDVYVPCWPLWRPLQFLREGKKESCENFNGQENYSEDNLKQVKTEIFPEDSINIEPKQFDIDSSLQIDRRTDRPRHRGKPKPKKCLKVLNNLVEAMKPLKRKRNSYWYFGRHVSERLNCMKEIDAECASREIMMLISDMNMS